MKYSVKNAFGQLIEDKWRRSNPFSNHITTANRVLLHPFATREEKEEAIGLWLQRYQPCIFGRVAAKTRRIHYCIIKESDLLEADSVIQSAIAREKKLWKQLALSGRDFSAHSFVVLVCSERILLAAPDNAFRSLALALQLLITTTKESDDYGNDRAFECVYLKHPKDERFYKFAIIMDFFAAAGDGRWWTDHRVPGGLAFTFNSLGHLVRTQEWYTGQKERQSWAVRLAMATIDSAEVHPKHGKATWLIELENGKPFKSLGCPFARTDALPSQLKGKDWTTYEGFHHTDHSVRAEFFDTHDSVSTATRPWRMDFSYIFSRDRDENAALMDGIPISEDIVYGDIDRPEEWRIGPPVKRSSVARVGSDADQRQSADLEPGFVSSQDNGDDRPASVRSEIGRALSDCQRWEMSVDEVEALCR